ncbi:unnamed protein product [Leuciscus chuanchicus]
MISLNLIGFELAKVDKAKRIKKIQANSMRDLKKIVGKSRLYVVPRAEVCQTSNMPPNPAITDGPETTNGLETSNMPLNPAIADGPETTNGLETSNMPLNPAIADGPETTNGLEEWRAIRRQQDLEYEQSLRADQEKIIEERLMRRTEEPAEGIPLKFTFPDGTIKIRRFQVSDEMQVLFDFVGTHSSATEYFYIKEATSAISIINTISGTLLDHYLISPLNIHVRWMDMEDVQAICVQQNPVLTTSDELEASEVIQVDLEVMDSGSQELIISNHSEVFQSDLEIVDPGPEIYTNYIDIMPDNDIDEPDDQELQDGSEIMHMGDLDCSTEEILLELGQEINYNQSCRFNINRKNLLDGAFRAFTRKSYDPFKRISVRFSDECGNFEEAVDLGGPRREFLTLLMEAIEKSALLAGPDGRKNLALDSVEKTDTTLLVKQLLSAWFTGDLLLDSFHQLCSSTCICNGNVSPTIDDVNDLDLQAKIQKIANAATMDEICQATESITEYLANAGCLRAIKCLGDKDQLVDDILMFQVVNRVHGPLERFREGLTTLGLLEAVVKRKEAFRPLFCSPQQPLTADTLEDLFNIRYSDAGSNRRAEENTAVAFWRDYLLDAEGK